MGPKIDQKSIKKGGQHGKASWHRFLIDFRRFGVPRWASKSIQNRLQIDLGRPKPPEGRPRIPQELPRPPQDLPKTAQDPPKTENQPQIDPKSTPNLQKNDPKSTQHRFNFCVKCPSASHSKSWNLGYPCNTVSLISC